MQLETQQLKDREVENLNKRCQDLRDQCMRLELAYSQSTESLAQLTSQADRLRSENANMQAERALWKVGLFWIGLDLVLTWTRKLSYA
jgi:nucleoprotein TPR